MPPWFTLFLSVLFAVAFIIQCLTVKKPESAEESKIGKIYYHINPGLTDNPDESPRPFAQIITVKEIKGESLRYEAYSVTNDGGVTHGEHWRKISEFPSSVEHRIEDR